MDSKKVWMWVGIAAAVVAVVALAWLLLSGNQASVPDVVGKQAGDAVRELQDAGFVLGDSTETTDTDVPVGAVVEQTPEGGAKAEKGSAVSIVVSTKVAEVEVPEEASKDATVTVPDVTSKEASPAADSITAAGLVPVVYRDYNADAAAGTVFGQVPAAGDEVAPGTSVAIGVSLGAAPTNPRVPNVVGRTRADATSALGRAGFGVRVYEAYSATVTAGVVFTQFPAANTPVLAGSTVAIGVSKGRAPTTPAPPANVAVPNVVGQTEANASKALKNAGLGVNSYTIFSDTVAKGSVVGQLPSAGASVARGTVVGIAVSDGKAPQSVTVPDLVGKTADDAYKALEGLGLQAVSVSDPSASEPDGTVIDQQPEAGSKVPPNFRVVLVIAGGAVPEPY